MDMLNEYKQFNNVTIVGPQEPALMSQKELYIALREINLNK